VLKGKKVRIRLKRHFIEQKLWVFLGETLEFTENWVMVNGRGILFLKGDVEPLDIDEEPRVLLIPRDNIAHIRVLPDNFDVSDIRIGYQGRRVCVAVEGAPYTSIGERAED
jgi:hypothetical protein